MAPYSYALKTEEHNSRSFSATVGWALIVFFVISYAFAAYESSSIWTQSPEAMVILGANYAPLTWHGQEWRLFTHMFLHANVFHLLVNSLAVWAVWKRSAMVFNTGTQLYIFFVCGVFSGWVGAIQQFSTVTVGSSGAILGLLASVVGWSITRSYIRWETKKAVAGFPAVVLGIVMVAGFFLPGIDSYANLGGVLSGLLFGIFISSKSEREHRAVKCIALIAVTLSLFCGALLFSRPSAEKMRHVQREQVSAKAIELIYETDRKAEDAMKRLWASETTSDKPIVSEKLDGLAGINAKAQPTFASHKSEGDWPLRWHAQVVIPMERNAAMAASLQANPKNVYFEHLNLLQTYTAARLDEARLLELGRDQIQRIGATGAELRQRIIGLNVKMEALNKAPIPDKP